MAKRGGTAHQKRLAITKEIPINNKKEYTWIIKQAPGPHPKKHSIPLLVFLREMLKIAKTSKEASKILNQGAIKIDGKIRKKADFPIGFMDVVSLKTGENYRIIIDTGGRLRPVPINEDQAKTKVLKVVKKHTAPKGKHILTFHDGRNLIGDNNVSVGDSVIFSLKDYKLASLLKLEKGCRCLIREGKHVGVIATLKDIQPRIGRPDEAIVNTEKEEFITVAKYLFVLDKSFKGAS